MSGIIGTWLMNETLLLNTSISSGTNKFYDVTGFYNTIIDGELVELPIEMIRVYRWQGASDIALFCVSSDTQNCYYKNSNNTALTGSILVKNGSSYKWYNSSNANWEALRTFTITGGTDVENAAVVSLITSNATKIEVSTPTTITCNGVDTELNEGQTATLHCANKKAESDIVVVFGSAGNITYNGTETAVESGKTATLECNGKKMETDVVIAL